MQISIDAATATPAALRLTSALLLFIANHKENPNAAQMPFPTPPVAPVEPAVAVTNVGTAPVVLSDASGAEGDRVVIPPPADGLLLDSAKVAWNPEHHTANQSQNADGTWRRKRTVKGEVAQTVQLPVNPVPQVPPPPPQNTTVETVPAVPPAPTASAATPAVAVPVVPPAPPVLTVVPNGEITTFMQLVKFATNFVGKKQISTAQLLEACAECGVPDIHTCNKPENLALIPMVAAAIQKRVTG